MTNGSFRVIGYNADDDFVWESGFDDLAQACGYYDWAVAEQIGTARIELVASLGEFVREPVRS